MSRKHLLLKGAFILTLTGFATRFMGFFFRIFLSHTFGEEGVGLYQLIFPVYALCFSLTCSGIQTALSRCVAGRIASGREAEARELLRAAILLTLTASCCCALFLQRFSGWIAQTFLQEPRCSQFLVILSYAFPFAALHSCIVGYYLGRRSTRVPAVSQLIEQAVRILSVFLFCQIGIKSGAPFGISVAVAGLVMGEIASSAYSLQMLRSREPSSPRKKRPFSLPPVRWRALRELVSFSLPLTASRVSLNILQSVEAVSIPLCLQAYGMTSQEALSIYGVLTGMALPLILFPSAITNSLSTMLLPTVAQIQAARNRQGLARIIRQSVSSCVLLGCLCQVTLLAFGEWLGRFLFHSPLAGSFILTLSWICPFLYVNNTLVSILNGLGKTVRTFLINASSLALRIGGVFLLIPVFGIKGYLWGLLASQIWVFGICLLCLPGRKKADQRDS